MHNLANVARVYTSRSIVSKEFLEAWMNQVINDDCYKTK